MPVFALLLVTVLELDTAAAQIVVMFTAMPTASSAYILATRMGGDGPYVAFLISVSMVASLVTLPLWLSLVH
jgi:predicted permease